MDEHEKLIRAKQQVAAMTGFYTHLAVFVFVLAILFVVNASAGSNWWVQWPLLGWGIFLLGHAVLVFGGISGRIRTWQADKVREIADKM